MPCPQRAPNLSVSPISKYLQQQGIVKSDSNIARHEDVVQKDSTELDVHWSDMFNIDDAYIEYNDELLSLLEPFEAICDGHLGTVNITQHRIVLEPGAKPVFQPPYLAGPRQREFEKAEIQKMMEVDVIEPAVSEWAAPIVFAPKKDGSLRFCIDYRRLNAVTIRDSYPIPRMDECIDSLGDTQVFSTLDCNSGYWQLEVAPEDRHKTAFVSHHGLYQ